MFERFTDDARRALAVAQDECRRLGQPKIRSGHLALGALAAGDPVPRAAGVPEAIVAALGRGDADTGEESVPFAGSARRVIAGAVKRADAEHRPLVDRFDLLLAALDEPAVAEPAAVVVDLDALREAAAEARQAQAPTGDDLVVALLRQVIARLDVIEARLDDRRG